MFDCFSRMRFCISFFLGPFEKTIVDVPGVSNLGQPMSVASPKAYFVPASPVLLYLLVRHSLIEPIMIFSNGERRNHSSSPAVSRHKKMKRLDRRPNLNGATGAIRRRRTSPAALSTAACGKYNWGW